MSLWRQLTRGIRALVHRSAADRDVEDEVRHFIEETRANLEAQGLSADEARRVAQSEMGDVAAVRETVRSQGWETTIETTVADIRYGVRRFRQNRMFAVVSVLTLALGIGASTAIFSVVNPILFESLPYPEANRLVMIWDKQKAEPMEVTFGTYREVLKRSRTFDAITVARPFQATLTSIAEPERLEGQYVSADYFHVLGVRPAIGRDFLESEDKPNIPFVAIISDSLWRRRFAADAGIVGRQVLIEDTPVTVIGIMPRGFENVLSPSAEVWSTLQYDTSLPLNGREWGHHLRMVARLRDGVRLDQARAELDSIASNKLPEFPRPQWASVNLGFIARRLQDDLTQPVRPVLFAVMGAVILLLTIACVNVTSLLMGRGVERSGELAVRAALGASRLRLTRQLLAETVVLAGAGCLLGIVLAHTALNALVALSPPGLPRIEQIELNGSALAFASGLTVLVGLFIGIVPAVQSTRVDRVGTVQSRSMRVAAGQPFTARVLVSLQVALAVVLLVCSGLLFRTVQHVFSVPPGFDATKLLTMQVTPAGARFRDANVTERFFAEALAAVRQAPGVTGAAVSSQLPLAGDQGGLWGVQLESLEGRNESADAYRYAVSPGYFEAMRIPLRSGRFLNTADTADAPFSAVISESLSRRLLPGLDPIGKRLRVGPSQWLTIVGVVADVKQTSLVLDRAVTIYVTSAQSTRFVDRARWFVIRTDQDAAELTATVRQAIRSVDKNPPIVRIATMADRLEKSVAERSFALRLFATFGIVALILALIGTYSLLSGSVTQRTREIGVRSALGGSRMNILALILRQGMVLSGVGIVIGMIGAAVASRALVTLLFEVSRLDVVTYVGVLILLLSVSALACAIPAWRAVRISPSVALRSE
jgi:putative ABC transport system permease protein